MSRQRLKLKPKSRRGNAPKPRRLVRSAPRPLNRVEAYFALQVETFRDSFRRLRQTPLASTLTVLVIAIAFTLPMGFHALVKNGQIASTGLEATSQISLFLKPDLSNEAGRKVAERLKKHPQIAEAGLITKEAGLKELQTYSGFGDALNALDFNPLPPVVSIKPRESLTDPAAMDSLLAELGRLPEADFAQFDTEWLRKLHALLAIAERGIVVFSALLGFGVLFIVGNTIRLELQHRREEIVVIKLLGATDRFIRRPFLYAGFWYAFLGGCLAWLLVNLLILLLRGPATQLAELYGSPFRLSFLGLAETELLLGASVVLGISGAWAVVSYHLRRLNPE
jgi:cell division transport system permease protein